MHLNLEEMFVGNCSDSPCGCQFHVVHDVERADTWVIPLLGEMSQSDKRVAVVLRTPLRL